MIEQDGAVLLFGEISSASSLTIMQVAERDEKFLLDRRPLGRTARQGLQPLLLTLRHSEHRNGQRRRHRAQPEGHGAGREVRADGGLYFGHDLLKAAKAFFSANDATLIGDELIATDVADAQPVLLKVRQAKPECRAATSPATKHDLVKQYAEFGLPYPLVGFNLNTGDAWAMGKGNLSGTWPTVWYHTLDNPASKAFVEAFSKKYGKPPENHAWIEYITLKMIAQAITETKSTESDALIDYFEKQTQFDIMKGRKAYFRSWDHQLVQEAYPFTVKPKNEMKDKWDMLVLGGAIKAWAPN